MSYRLGPSRSFPFHFPWIDIQLSPLTFELIQCKYVKTNRQTWNPAWSHDLSYEIDMLLRYDSMRLCISVQVHPGKFYMVKSEFIVQSSWYHFANIADLKMHSHSFGCKPPVVEWVYVNMHVDLTAEQSLNFHKKKKIPIPKKKCTINFRIYMQILCIHKIRNELTLAHHLVSGIHAVQGIVKHENNCIDKVLNGDRIGMLFEKSLMHSNMHFENVCVLNSGAHI